MHIIKLDATDSTNSYIKNAMLSEVLDDFTVVVANSQRQGRGQMGTKWQSEAGKNLTFSILKKFEGLDVRSQFTLTIRTSLAILDVLKTFQIPDVSIKWPNDILSGSSKICGILIENILNTSGIYASVLGIGLNINQVRFKDLTKVTSMKLLLGITWDTDEILTALIDRIAVRFGEAVMLESLYKDYESVLFRKDSPSTFRDRHGNTFPGVIRGVTGEGKLRLETAEGVLSDYAHKEVQLLY